jgi:uncharacterized protein YbjT (DUF2867 family)
MILITGATGTIGSEFVRLLAAKGEQVRAMTRRPSRIEDQPGVEVARGDFGDHVPWRRRRTEPGSSSC